MNKLLIFGTNYFSELISECVEQYSDRTVDSFIVHRDYITDTSINGKDVIPYEDIEQYYAKNEVEILVTSGYRKMNNLRKEICIDLKRKGYNLYTFIHPKALVYADSLGEGNIILEGAIISKHVRIGTGNIIWNGVNISHHTIIGDYNFFAPSSVVGGRCEVKNNCFMGLNSTVKGGIKVDNYTLVGAGAYLEKSSEENDVYVFGRREKLEGKNSLEML